MNWGWALCVFGVAVFALGVVDNTGKGEMTLSWNKGGHWDGPEPLG